VSGVFDLKQKVDLFFAPQWRLMNHVIDLRVKNCLLHNKIQLKKDAE